MTLTPITSSVVCSTCFAHMVSSSRLYFVNNYLKILKLLFLLLTLAIVFTPSRPLLQILFSSSRAVTLPKFFFSLQETLLSSIVWKLFFSL